MFSVAGDVESICYVTQHFVTVNCCSCGNIPVHKSSLTPIQLRRIKQSQHRWKKCHRPWSGPNDARQYFC